MAYAEQILLRDLGVKHFMLGFQIHISRQYEGEKKQAQSAVCDRRICPGNVKRGGDFRSKGSSCLLSLPIIGEGHWVNRLTIHHLQWVTRDVTTLV